jgi:predicted DNA-binding protein YlxM (UPF0122 family)
MKRKYTVTDRVKKAWDEKTKWSKRMNVVRLREQENLSFREIGEACGTTPQAIHELYHKAKEQVNVVEKKGIIDRIFKK